MGWVLPVFTSPGPDQTQLVHTVWIQSAWYQLRYREALNFLPAAARPGRCSRTDGLNRRTGSEPVLIGKYRSITLSRPTLPGPLEMRPNNAAIASSFAQLGRKEVPVGFQPFPFKTAPRKGFLPVGSHFFLPRMNDGGFQNGGSVMDDGPSKT